MESDPIKNLKLDSKTPEERKEILSRAGKNSARSRRKKRDLKKCLALLMESEVPESDQMQMVRKMLMAYGIEDTEDMTYGAAVSVAMLQKAIKGNVKAAEFIRDAAGMNPELTLKQEMFKHQKKMDMIRLGQTDIQKADVTPLLNALEKADVEDA